MWKVGIKTLKSELYEQPTEAAFVTEFYLNYGVNTKVCYRLVLPVMEWIFFPAGTFPTCIQLYPNFYSYLIHDIEWMQTQF